MEIKTRRELLKKPIAMCASVTHQELYWNKEWVAIDEDIKRALSLYFHIKNHKEVQESINHPNHPMCKICNKTSMQIRLEEWEKLSQK